MEIFRDLEGKESSDLLIVVAKVFNVAAMRFRGYFAILWTSR